MDPQQNSTQIPGQTPIETITVEPVPEKVLITPQQEDYIAFVACGGMLPSENPDELIKKMSAQEFADLLEVDRGTLYYWRNHLPGFWDLVEKKRKEIGGKDRLSKVWNGLFLKAASGNPQAAAIYLANFDPNFRMPNEKAEKEREDNYAALLAMAAKDGIIEGEIVEPKAIDTSASNSDQPAYP